MHHTGTQSACRALKPLVVILPPVVTFVCVRPPSCSSLPPFPCSKEWGGSNIRPEATGYGAVYFGQEVLKETGETFEVRCGVCIGGVVLCFVVAHCQGQVVHMGLACTALWYPSL